MHNHSLFKSEYGKWQSGFTVKFSFNKQQFYLLHRSLHLIYPSPLTLKLVYCVYPWKPNLQSAVVIHCIAMSNDILGNQKNNTQYSNVVPHFISNWSLWCLTLLGIKKRFCHCGIVVPVSIERFGVYDSSCYINMPFACSIIVHSRYVVAVILPLQPYLWFQ